MMGQHSGQKELMSFCIDLDKRIRSDHPLGKIATKIDFSFVRDEVKDCYGKNGNVSVDPEILLKLMFLLFYENVSSERALMKILPERLDWLWFLRMGLDDPIPDHSVLSKARARWGEEVFESFFVRIVAQCLEAGLIEGNKIYLDGSLVDADASNDSIISSSPELIEALREAYQGEVLKLDGSAGQPHYQAQNAQLISRTDPDAPCVRNVKIGGSGDSRARYKQHRAVNDAHGVITAIKTTPGTVQENSETESLIDQHEHNTGKTVETVVGDKQYGTVQNYRSLQKRNINTHLGELHSGNAPRYDKIFGPEHFRYVAEIDIYICPAGQSLHPRRYQKRRKVTEYLTRKGTCDHCELRDQCTRAKHGRSIARHHEHELVEKGRQQSRSAEARKDIARRKHLIEGSFADAQRHHFKRSRWRRLYRQRMQDFLIATVQNVKIIIKQPDQNPRIAASMGIIDQKQSLISRNILVKTLYQRLRRLRSSRGKTVKFHPAYP